MNTRDKFLRAMYDAGVIPARKSEIEETFDELKRFHTVEDKAKKPSGYYMLTIDGDVGVGCFGTHRQGHTHTWHSRIGRKLTDAEKARYKERMEAAKVKRDEALAKQRANAAKRASTLYKQASPAPDDHPYLAAKGVLAFKSLRVASGKIIVPVWNAGKMVGLQYIDEDGDKRFLSGTVLSGSFYPIATNGEIKGGGSRKSSSRKSKLLICEGVATGLTLRQATDHVVVCAFNAGNLKPVAKAMREKHPDAEIIICADNDQWTVRAKRSEGVDKDLPGDHQQWEDLRAVDALVNPGVEAAQQAAHAVNGYVCFPAISPHDKDKRTDFNDLAAMAGLEAVAETVGRVGDEVVAAKLGLGEGAADGSPAIAPPLNNNEQVPADLSTQAPTDWLRELAWTNREEGKLDKGKPLHNAIIWLREHKTWESRFCYNLFTHKTVVLQPLPWDDEKTFKPRELDNRDLTRIKAHLEKYGMSLPANTVKDAIEVASERNSYNPVKEYFERIEWDGKPRLDRWLIDYCGCTRQGERYVKSVGSKWLIAAARRVYEPGTPFHHMLVMEGVQGVRKSTVLKEMATFGQSDEECFFTDRFTFGQIDDKYAALHLLGHLIIEFQELTGLSSKDRNKVKGWVVQTHDEIRKPFAATTDKYPRQFVLAGTTNDTQWMVDTTGNRRFWPVVVTKVYLEELKRDKEQLWAEAVHRYKQGELWYINDTDEAYDDALEEQRCRVAGDVWEGVVMDGIAAMTPPITMERILGDVINLPRERWTNRDKMRIGTILRENGYENVRKRWRGRLTYMWVPKGYAHQENEG